MTLAEKNINEHIIGATKLKLGVDFEMITLRLESLSAPEEMFKNKTRYIEKNFDNFIVLEKLYDFECYNVDLMINMVKKALRLKDWTNAEEIMPFESADKLRAETLSRRQHSSHANQAEYTGTENSKFSK